MKTRFIRINDISEIDTSKASVYDLSNRYIDARGNMYGLRYNRTEKKIEIIKIIRTPAKTSSYYQQKLAQYRRDKLVSATDKNDLEDEGPPSYEDADFDEAAFEPTLFIDHTLELAKTHRDRLNGIIMNIKNSKVIPETDRMEYNTLNSIFRNIDIDGIKRIEKVVDNHKELINYPRSLSYYQSKLDAPANDIYETLQTDESRMQFIFFFEMYQSLKNLYTALHNIFTDLEYLLQDKDIDEMKHLTFSEKQQYKDAMISIENTSREVKGIIRSLDRLRDYVYHSENY